MKFLSKLSDEAYALLRMISGFLFSFHGLQKIFGILSSRPQPVFGTQIWIGGLIELVCGLAIMVGFKTRIAAFLASGTMAVAYMQFHWRFQMNSAFFPVVNQGELAVLYCFLFLYMACRGGGKWSIKD